MGDFVNNSTINMNVTDSVMDLKCKALLDRLSTAIHLVGTSTSSSGGGGSSSNEDRSLRYKSLGSLAELLASPFRRNADKVLFSLVDRVSAFAEGADSAADFLNYLKFLELFLDSTNSELRSNIDKIIPKLVSLAIRLTSRAGKDEFGVNILLVVLQSNHRSLASQQCMTIREAVSGLVLYAGTSSLGALACHVAALTHSLDSGEVWSQALLAYSLELVACMKSIGMPTSGVPFDYTTNSTRATKAFEAKKSANFRGLEKATLVMKEFKGISLVVQKMLQLGCSGGHAPMDLTLLLPLATNLLSTYIRISPTDSKIHVENDQHVSLLDLASVSSELKISFLGILEGILTTRHSSLITIATRLLRPLAIVLESDEMKQVVEISHGALRCFQLAAQYFPTIVSKNSSLYGLDSIISLFDKAANHIMKSDSSIIQSNETTDINGFEAGDTFRVTAAVYPLIFSTIEKTLIFCGPLLTAATRSSIEITTGKLLLVLNKGVAHLQFADRRIKFLGKELVRTNAQLQTSLLSLALAEVLSSGCQSGGVYSSNITLLKQAAALCLRQNETSHLAAQVAQALEACLHPTSVPLMTTPLCVLTDSIIKSAAAAADAVAEDSRDASSAASRDDSLRDNDSSKFTSSSFSASFSDSSVTNNSKSISAPSLFDKTESSKISSNDKRSIESVNGDSVDSNSYNNNHNHKKNRSENSISDNNSNNNSNSNSSNSSSIPAHLSNQLGNQFGAKSFTFGAPKLSNVEDKKQAAATGLVRADAPDDDELPDLE